MNKLKNGVKSTIREIVFGMEDSLVSTLGAVTGIAVGTASTEIVLLSGIVLIFVEALSMTAGSYLSSKSAKEASRKKEAASPTLAAAVMGIFYLLGGIFPILPYFLLSTEEAIIPSIISTALVLFALGFWKAWIVGTNKIKSGLEMMSISLFAALLGYLIGDIASNLLNINIY